MGIDAKILLRSPREFSPAELRKMCHSLGSTVGADKFFFPTVDWEKSGDLDTRLPIGPVVGDWEQDGPSISPEADEHFYRINIWSRYYGPGYERGDWPGIRSIIEFFWYNYPEIQVWYGGDSSGVCAEHMTRAAVDAINRYFYLNGHRPYHAGFGLRSEAHTCPRCQEPCADHGGGGGDTFFICHGCGDKFICGPNAPSSIKLPRHGKDNDFFSAHSKLCKGEPLDAN